MRRLERNESRRHSPRTRDHGDGVVRVSALALILLLTGCAPEMPETRAEGSRPPRSAGLAQFIEFFDSLRVQEPAGVVNVAPIVIADRGGFLVIDVREGQGRVYDRRGVLLARFGRPGRGPGEYINPMGVVRNENGEIVVLEFDGRLTSLREDADSVLRTAKVPVGPPLYGLRILGPDQLLVLGRTFGLSGADLLHILNGRGDSVTRSFFPAPAIESGAPHLIPITWMSAAIRGDTIFATYGFVDSLYLFSVEGHRLGAVHVSIQGMAAVDDSRRVRKTPAEVRSWLAGVRRISDVFVLSSGAILVQTTRVEDRDPHWGLVAVDPRGEVLFDFAASPRVLATLGDTVIMITPGSDTPDRWTLGRLRAP